MSIQIDPKSAKTYYNRGIAYGTLGQWEKAIADYSSTIEIDPNYTMAYSNRDIAYRKLSEKKR
jgi:tetratricopeptide (TPR) repeat protein